MSSESTAASTHTSAELYALAAGHAEAKVRREPLLGGQCRQGWGHQGRRHLLPAQRTQGPQHCEAILPSQIPVAIQTAPRLQLASASSAILLLILQEPKDLLLERALSWQELGNMQDRAFVSDDGVMG